MAVGLGPLSTLHPVPGFELGIASAGIKRPGRKDVVVMRCAEGSSVAGVFTLNAFCAAPVTLAKQRFLGEVRALAICASRRLISAPRVSRWTRCA
ncbi:bifunctional ornithine acetyltransferase/N-acetylglutamate synthase, partial [Pseudomonas aeruginosa]